MFLNLCYPLCMLLLPSLCARREVLYSGAGLGSAMGESCVYVDRGAIAVEGEILCSYRRRTELAGMFMGPSVMIATMFRSCRTNRLIWKKELPRRYR